MTLSKTSLLWPPLAFLGLGFWLWGTAAELKSDDPLAQGRAMAQSWRTAHRVIDLHQHLTCTKELLPRAVRIMDRAGIGVGVNLSGGTVTRKDGKPSEFQRNKEATDQLYPGRFLHCMNLDYDGWESPDFSRNAVKQVEEGHRLGAACLKEYKRLGLFLRDKSGALLKIDDPRLDPVWQRCGELQMPISIHVGDPRAFWLPFDPSNERWKELGTHKNWWFGDRSKHPPREELLEALNRVIARHPRTTFVCVHLANNPEDLEWVGRSLDRLPNMMADIAARVPEIGRQDPEAVHRFFVKYQDRLLFATDFMVLPEKLILGSSGDAERPTEDDGVNFYAGHWRWFETRDRNFAHMTPIQGDWTISGIGLPPEVVRKVYFENARKLLARSLSPPRLVAARIAKDFDLKGDLSASAWKSATPVMIDQQSETGEARSALATTVRALWSDNNLYLGYSAPFTALTTFQPVQEAERFGLWEKDVVEAFIGSDPNEIVRYEEFQVSPTNERLDLTLVLPQKDFIWSSRFTTAVKVDDAKKVWTAEMRIPLDALASNKPKPGARWRINLLRCDYANKAFLAWNPTGKASFHVPEKFGTLEFAGKE
jgi:predicted TIM-barrel fold metal-dependent hydrolase